MLMTVTNLTSRVLNAPIVGGNQLSADAVGGTRSDVLPYPFSHVVLQPAGSMSGGRPTDAATLPVHSDDMRFKSVPWLPLEPSREWAMLVQKGTVSVAFSSEEDSTNPEDALGYVTP